MNDSRPPSSRTLASLAPGDRLGPYEIVGLLGSGGMGEVYRAHDARLGRSVAIKVLRDSRTDPEQVARFAREARAAGGLNHPNIVAVFDIARQGGVPYVVTELLEGETLRARLNRGPIPYRKAIEYGIQIAQALDAAHAKGIWHRDVKPANIFVTDDGRVKLLDFGIAKLTEREATLAAQETTVESTQEGEIRGTAGYMSPEQVLGEPLDHRSDIFAFGAVLYEMFTGARAFNRPSNVETMNAVLQQEPESPISLNPKLPAGAAAIVQRCLEKNREDRFQSMRDLAFDLQQLREVTGSTRPLAAARPTWRRLIVPAALLVPLLAGGVGLALWPHPQPPPAFEQINFRRGRIGGARFASDGQAVVYSEAARGNVLEVWRRYLSDPTPANPLGYPAGTDILSAREGDLALSVRRRFILGERFVGTLAVAPMGGGAPRELADHVEDADYDPVTGGLAIVRSTGDVSGPSRIEFPIGKTLYSTDGSLRFLRFSRDGQRLAFLEDGTNRGVGGRVGVLDRDGAAKFLTKAWTSVRGVGWSIDDTEVWFAAGERTQRMLRAVTLDGTQRTLLEVPGSLTLWDIAPDGRVLLTRDEERRAVLGTSPGDPSERDLSWYDNSGVADITDDGRALLLADRFGVYLRGTDGSPAVLLGLKDGFADDISPDGSTILGTMDESRQLVLVPMRAGELKVLPAFGISKYSGARWFPDGKRILFAGRNAEGDLRSYVQAIAGGAPTPITPERTWGLTVSPDGKLTAAIGPDHKVSLWPVDGGEPRPLKGSEVDDRPVAWSADGKSLWIFRRGEIPAHVYQINIETGRRQLWKTLLPPDTAGVYSVIEFFVTPTGHAYCYSYTRLLSQLYVARGLN